MATSNFSWVVFKYLLCALPVSAKLQDIILLPKTTPHSMMNAEHSQQALP